MDLVSFETAAVRKILTRIAYTTTPPTTISQMPEENTLLNALST